MSTTYRIAPEYVALLVEQDSPIRFTINVGEDATGYGAVSMKIVESDTGTTYTRTVDTTDAALGLLHVEELVGASPVTDFTPSVKHYWDIAGANIGPIVRGHLIIKDRGYNAA